MPRIAARKDANQDELREFLHALGYETATIHQLGGGLPDIIVGAGGITLIGRFDQERMIAFLREALDKQPWSPQIAFFKGANLLVEVKDGSKPPSARKLTKDEEEWHEKWTGQIDIWESIDQAMSALNLNVAKT